jgi:hypothetical protein
VYNIKIIIVPNGMRKCQELVVARGQRAGSAISWSCFPGPGCRGIGGRPGITLTCGLILSGFGEVRMGKGMYFDYNPLTFPDSIIQVRISLIVKQPVDRPPLNAFELDIRQHID